MTEKKIRFRREDFYYVDALYFCSKKCLKKNLPRKCAECQELSPSNCHAIKISDKIANKNTRLYFCDSDCFNEYCDREKEKEEKSIEKKSTGKKEIKKKTKKSKILTKNPIE
jgi:hypothetical protein